jgi:hypothetical protein
MSTFATLPAKERELFFRQYQERRGVDPVIAEKDASRRGRCDGQRPR